MSRSSPLHQQAQSLSEFDRMLVNVLQGDFPLSATPFDDLSLTLGYSPEQLMAGIDSLLQRGVITRFGPLFNIERLGGQFSLCALKVPVERYDEVVELVNAYSQVAHNYQREHEWNMWFVLAAESVAELEEVFNQIVARSDCPGLNLPKEKEFYVGLHLDA